MSKTTPRDKLEYVERGKIVLSFEYSFRSSSIWKRRGGDDLKRCGRSGRLPQTCSRVRLPSADPYTYRSRHNLSRSIGVDDAHIAIAQLERNGLCFARLQVNAAEALQLALRRQRNTLVRKINLHYFIRGHRTFIGSVPCNGATAIRSDDRAGVRVPEACVAQT